MPLVDYASDSDASGSSTNHAEPPPPKKKPRTASPPRTSGSGSGSGLGSASRPGPSATTSTLPPLPASFHDLYASTVRTTTHDNPALHQGRTRQTPHTPGTWPSHIYIEWHPPPAVHALLSELITALQHRITPPTSTSSTTTTSNPNAEEEAVEITTSLQSPLSTPQPLHISLSRPLSLTTPQKDAFLADAKTAITAASGVAAFALDCGRVEWHRTAESGRSFLVVRVHSHSYARRGSRGRPRDGEGDGDGDGDGEEAGQGDGNPNPELTTLLQRCNDLAVRYGQPGLYQWAEGVDRQNRQVGDAFHVSIAWSFAEPTAELVRATEEVFQGAEAMRRIREVQVPVDGVKVKIGNVVTHVGLRQPGGRVGGKGARNLLGL